MSEGAAVELQPIPVPEVLDPDRPRLEGLIDAEDRDQAVATMHQALHDACDYGRMLWNVVDRLRHYLMSAVPSDPRGAGPYRLGAQPTGPDDDDGWQEWMDAYAQATSALTGPHGDSGFGVSEAKREAELRRTASNVRILAEDRPRRADPNAPTDRPIADRLDDRFRSGAIVGAIAAIVTMDLLSRMGRRGRRHKVHGAAV
jgi:hypothetical protein